MIKEILQLLKLQGAEMKKTIVGYFEIFQHGVHGESTESTVFFYCINPTEQIEVS